MISLSNKIRNLLNKSSVTAFNFPSQNIKDIKVDTT